MKAQASALLMTFLLVSPSVFSQVESIENTSVTNNEGVNAGKGLELGLSLSRETLTSKTENDSLNGTKLSLGIGKIFFLNPFLKSTTSLGASLMDVKDDISDANDMTVNSSTFRDVGISQKFSYDIDTSNFSITPFVSGNYAIGSFVSNFTELGSELDMTLDYKRTTLAVGIEFNTNTSFVPYFQYSRSSYSFDNEVTVEGTVNGENVSITSNTDANLDVESSALTVGLNYFF